MLAEGSVSMPKDIHPRPAATGSSPGNAGSHRPLGAYGRTNNGEVSFSLVVRGYQERTLDLRMAQKILRTSSVSTVKEQTKHGARSHR
jgi:hypothetical protein